MNEYNPTNNSISSNDGNSTASSVVAVIPVDSANVVDAAAATCCQFEDVELADKTEMTDPTSSPSSSSSVNSSSEEEESTTLLGSARTPWYGTSLVLLAEVMGTGILSLPYAAVTLGWVSTLVLLPVFALLAYFSSAMLSYVQQRHPCIKSYGDAATQLIGPKFGTFSNACMLLNWGSLAIYYLVAASNAIADIAPDGWLGRCQLNRTIVAALLFLIPCQVRDFHSISKILSAPSFVAILIAVIIILVSLLDDSNTTDAVVTNRRRTTLGPLPGTDGFDFIGAMASIVFAYQGQSIFFELIGEMKHGQQFPRATLVAYLVMFLSYATTIVIAYGSNGADTPGFLPDILKSGSASAIAVSVLTLFHLIVAYVIAVQPLHVWFHKTFFSKTLYHSTWSGTRDWFIISFTFTLFGWTVANLIPFFADIQALIGTLFGAPIMFGWPPLFYFLTKRGNTESKTIKETVASMGIFYTIVSGFMMFILVPVFVIVGTWGSVKQIIEDAEDAGLPFQC